MSLSTVAVWVPSASAAGKIKLTGEVLRISKGSQQGECSHPSKIALFDGSREAGTIKVTHCAATGTGVFYHGSADLEVGKLTGRLRFGVAFHPQPPNFTAATPGSGMVENSNESERIRVIGPDLPSELGARFRVTLNERVSSF